MSGGSHRHGPSTGETGPRLETWPAGLGGLGRGLWTKRSRPGHVSLVVTQPWLNGSRPLGTWARRLRQALEAVEQRARLVCDGDRREVCLPHESLLGRVPREGDERPP